MEHYLSNVIKFPNRVNYFAHTFAGLVAQPIPDIKTMKVEPLIIVSSVEKSSKFYQNVLGLKSAHGDDEYERLTREGNLVLPLH